MFNETATTEIYTYLHTLSLHDALPIFYRGEPIAGADQGNPGRSPKRVEHLFLARVPGQLHRPIVKMRQRLRDFDRHRHDVELRIYALGVRPLVAGNVRLGDECVHDAAHVAFPRIGGPPQQGATSPLQEAYAFERCQGAYDRGRDA